jgi:hypothetical protein
MSQSTRNKIAHVKPRLGRVIATTCVCAAAATAVTVSEAHSNQRPVTQRPGHLSAQQLARKIHTLEAKGYVPAACTVEGTLLRNYSTGQSVTVKL